MTGGRESTGISGRTGRFFPIAAGEVEIGGVVGDAAAAVGIQRPEVIQQLLLIRRERGKTIVRSARRLHIVGLTDKPRGIDIKNMRDAFDHRKFGIIVSVIFIPLYSRYMNANSRCHVI